MDLSDLPKWSAGYVTCPECGRAFDLAHEPDADEWYYGHDCEEVKDAD